jgi:hypothetical protein
LNNPVYNMLLKSKPPPLTYEHYSAGLLAPPPVETISKERVNKFLARQLRHENQRKNKLDKNKEEIDEKVKKELKF